MRCPRAVAPFRSRGTSLQRPDDDGSQICMCVWGGVFGPPLNSEMCWLSLIWDEVHFVPKRCLLLPVMLLGIIGYSYVCLLHGVLLPVCLIPSTFSCSPTHQGWQEMAPVGRGWHQPTVTCITGQLGLPPPPIPSWPSPSWLLAFWSITGICAARLARMPSEKKKQNFPAKSFGSTNFVGIVEKSLRFEIMRLIHL